MSGVDLSVGPDRDFVLSHHRITYDAFVSAFDENASPEEAGALLLEAAANKDLDTRYAILTFLLDHGASASVLTPDGQNALHVMFGQVTNEPRVSAALAKRLIEAGADVNALDKRKILPLQFVLNMKFTDDELVSLYDVWFEQPSLDLSTPNAWGLSPLDLAKKVPYRATLVSRMEARLGA